jgi:hypothetical protein
VREIRTLRAMWRGLETTHGSDTEALSTETESKQSRPNLRSIGASPRPYRKAQASAFPAVPAKAILMCAVSWCKALGRPHAPTIALADFRSWPFTLPEIFPPVCNRASKDLTGSRRGKDDDGGQ